MKDKINLFALVVATVASIAVAVTIAAAHYAITTAIHVGDSALDSLRTLGWPEF